MEAAVLKSNNLIADPSASRTRYSTNRPPHSPTFSSVTFSDFTLPIELSYEADIWARVRKTIESYRTQAQASAAELAGVNLSIHANLAYDYFAARSLDAEEQLLQQTVVQYENALAIESGSLSARISFRCRGGESQDSVRNHSCSSD